MSRNYYLSQGGVFGIAEYDEALAGSTYMYGTDQDHIAYCGPYLCTNVTDKNSINYIANESYWNAENVQIKAVNFIYDDGSDVTPRVQRLHRERRRYHHGARHRPA